MFRAEHRQWDRETQRRQRGRLPEAASLANIVPGGSQRDHQRAIPAAHIQIAGPEIPNMDLPKPCKVLVILT